MSVDKFGRTDANVVQRVVTGGGVALTQANNIFLRRDGTSSLDGDLHMNGRWFKGLPTIYPMPLGHGDEAISWAQAAALVRDVLGAGSGVDEPTIDSLMTSKKYDLIKRITIMIATPTMTSSETIINGLTYIASASDPPLGIELRHEPWKAFDNLPSYPASWAYEVPENGWIQLKYPLPLSMKGFHIVSGSQSYNGVITMWKVQASNDGIVFDNIVSPNTTRFPNNTLHTFTFPASAKYAYWRFHMISMNHTDRAGMSLLQWIPTLRDRFNSTQCPLGYIPRLLSNVNYSGFEALGNGVLQTEFKAFKGDGSE